MGVPVTWTGLRARARLALTGGTAVLLATVAVSFVLRFVNTVILTHLLDPSAFGVVGIVLSITFFVQMFSDLGFIPFLVHHKDGDDSKLLDEVWTARLVRGAGLTVLTAALAGPLASYAGKPALQAVITVYSLSLLIDATSSMAQATALRHHQVKKISVFDVVAAVIQVISGILFSYITRDYWGIVISTIVTSIAKSILSYTMFHGSERSIKFSAKRMKELWGFSKFIVGSSALTAIISQTDKFYFARLLTLREYGFYSIATALAVAPTAVAHLYIERILFPVYASTFRQDPTALRDVYYQRKRLISLLYIFAVSGVIGAASLIVALIYKSSYQPVAALLAILVVASVLMFNNWAADRMLVATGNTRPTAVANLLRLAWVLAGAVLATLSGDAKNLIPVIGTIEVPAMLFYWFVLGKLKLLKMGEEFLALATAVIGAVSAWVFSMWIMSFVSL